MDVKYQRVKVIGKGAFGKAYLVKNTEDDSLCVVKQMETSMMDPKDRNEAVKEALFLKKMEHGNIIQFYEVFMTKKGRLCIVMEYADGGDVHDEIKKMGGKLVPEPTILSWFAQTCFAMYHVHERRVLHRDLKTQNIFLTKSGQIKLGDFGIARVLEATKDYAKTMVDTPYYLSPEIIQDKPYAYKSDVWSCGVVLFEMATLQHPFNADCLAVLAGKILQDEVPPIDKMYTSDLFELITRMLRKDSLKRPTFREALMLQFLHPTMRSANEDFKLGLDLAEFAPEKKLPEQEPPTPMVRGADDADNSGIFDNDFESESEPEDASSSLAKSVAALKLSSDAPAVSSTSGAAAESPLSFSSKAATLRRYLGEQTSEAEFAKVQTLLEGASGTSSPDVQRLKSQVVDLLGSDKAEPLLPMFQLLNFLEGIAANLEGEKSQGLIKDIFKRWDANQDGFITKEELQRVMTLLGVNTAEISTIFEVADTNKDGKIDYAEFVDWLYSASALSAFGKRLPSLK